MHQNAYVPSRTEALDSVLAATNYRLQPNLSPPMEVEAPTPPPKRQFTPWRPHFPSPVDVPVDKAVAATPEYDTRPAEFFLEIPEKNVDLVDGRKRTPISIVSSEHTRVKLRPDQAVGFDVSSLMVLSHIYLLRQTFSTFERIVVAPDFESQLQEQRNRVTRINSILAMEIDEIIAAVNDSIKLGNTNLPIRSDSDANSKGIGSGVDSDTTFEAWASTCDIICIDDPQYNGADVLPSKSDRIVSVACTVDILQALLDFGSITKPDYWLARHRLRQGGFTAIIPEPDELHHWISESVSENRRFIESIELRTIRHNAAHFARRFDPNARTSDAFLIAVTNVCSQAIDLLWADESLSIPDATLGSNWIWNHISSLRYFGESELEPNLIRLAAVCSVAHFLIVHDYDEERYAEYTSWTENTILPMFQCANSRIIDQSLDLIVDSIISNSDYDDHYGHIFLKRLPNWLAKDLLQRHETLGTKWNFKIERLITFDSGPSISINVLIKCARKAYRTHDAVHFVDDRGRPRVVHICDHSQAVLVDWPDDGGRPRSTHMSNLSLLSPSASVRVHTAQAIVNALRATGGKMRGLIADLECRIATDEEVSEVSRELVDGVSAIQTRIHRKFTNNGSIHIDDLVPVSMGYFEQLIGSPSMELDPDEFIRNVVIPYRGELIHLDLKSGLEIACIGFLSDSLAPGEWVRDFGNDNLWSALSSFNYAGSPFALLAALDIALYRQGDTRFRQLASKAMNTLCDRSFGRSDSFDAYEALHIVIELVENRINLLDSGAIMPGCWKRIAAWMQAALFVGDLADHASPETISALKEFAADNMTIAGRYARTASARFEPLPFAARTTPDLLHVYLIERLLALKWRHEGLGHEVPNPSDLDLVHPVYCASNASAILGLPGPLDGHRVPTELVPPELDKAWLADSSAGASDFPWQAFVTLSQARVLDASQLAVFRTAVSDLHTGRVALSVPDLLRYADCAGMVASASRDRAISDAVVDLVSLIAASVDEASQVAQLIQCLLQAAGAFGDLNAWSVWLDEKLVQMSNQLPPSPSEVSRVFVDSLDELAVVLPVESWIHLRARTVAACIAPTDPEIRADFIEGGWLRHALSSLEGIREEAHDLGFDMPTDTTIQAAGAFLKSLAQVVRQTPDVQPLHDGEVAIDFCNQTERGGVLFVVEVDGSGACYTIADGFRRSFVRSHHEDLLDEEIREAISAAGVG